MLKTLLYIASSLIYEDYTATSSHSVFFTVNLVINWNPCLGVGAGSQTDAIGRVLANWSLFASSC